MSAGFTRHIAIIGCLLAILGAKIWLIAAHGSEMPEGDQWAGEAQDVYRPYLNGELKFSDLYAFHNVHRIFFTRASGLALLIASGRWDPVIQMLSNSIVHLAAIGLLLVFLRRLFGVAGFLLVSGFTLLLFALPFGWQNTAFGFQMQFYALILLSLLSLYCLCCSAAWSIAWCVGTLLAVASYFAMASGALTLPAFIAVAAVQFAVRQRTGPREASGILLHAAIALVILLDAPRSGERPEWMERELMSWLYSSFIAAASWPIASYSWPMALRWIPAVLMYFPAIWLTVRTIGRRSAIADRNWLLVAIAVWEVAQMCALTLGRTGDTVESRYVDILLPGVVVNCACLVQMLRSEGTRLTNNGKRIFAACWLFAAILGGGQKATDSIPEQLRWKRELDLVQSENLKNFLVTGDYSHLRDKPDLHIPFPYHPDILADITSDPAIKSILPPQLSGQPQKPDVVKTSLLKNGPMLLPLGLFLFIVATLGARTRRDDDSGSVDDRDRASEGLTVS